MRRAPEFILDSLIGAGIVILLLSPFPYGTVLTWSVSFFEIVSFLTLGLFCLKQILAGRLNIKPSPIYLPMTLFLVLALIQLIPVPLNILKFISPNTEALLIKSSEVLSSIFSEDTIKSFTLSINPYATKEKILLFLSYGAFFIVSSNHIVSRDQLKKYFWLIFGVGLIQSLIGISQYITSSGTAAASGTYVNPNHFGGLLTLIIPLSLGYILYLGKKAGQSENLLNIIKQHRFSNQLLIFFATGLMAIAVVMSQSRGALMSVVAAILVFYALISWRKKTKSGGLFIGLFVATIAAYSIWIGVDPVIEKFADTTETLPLRTNIWQDSISIIKDFPLFGTGLGTYPLSFSLYKETVSWPTVVQHAHNDYLELFSETGIIGFVLVFWALAIFYRNTIYRIIRRNSSSIDPLRNFLLLGATSGTLGMMVHVFTDFNFQIPANAYYFVFLIGICTSIMNYSRSDRT